MRTLLTTAVLCGWLGVAAAQTGESSAPPPLIPFTGVMAGGTGQPRVGLVSAIFALYEDQNGGVPLWVEIQSVDTDTGGGYLVLLGAATELPVDFFAQGDARWLGVQPEGQAEQPRVQFLSVPYALKAGDADTLGGRPLSAFALIDTEDGELSSTSGDSLTTTSEDTVELGTLNVLGNTALGTAGAAGARLDVRGSLLFGANSRGSLGEVSGDLALDLNSGASFFAIRHASAVEIARFTSTERVGIGTSAPQERLDVAGNIRFGPNSRGTLGETSGDLSLDLNSGANFFAIRDTSANSIAHFTNTGLVGIGTSVPLQKLDVIGNIRFGPNSRGTLGEASGDLVLDMNAGAGFFAVRDSSANQLLHVSSTGNVGIGTSSPSTALEVVGSVIASGTVSATGGISATYQDVAEWVEAVDPLPPGTVVIADSRESNRVRASSRAYDTAVLGAISLKPGLALGEPSPTKVLVAQSGRVKVMADASYGAIAIGDILATSETPGHARRSEPVRVGELSLHRSGTVLGKALEPLDAGRGEILVLITLQ